MPDFAVQGRPGFRKGYAQAVELQGLHVSRGPQGRCSCIESKRRTLHLSRLVAYLLTVSRTFDPQTKWKKRSVKRNPQNSKN
jgi:hypothetical protein